MKRRIRVTGLIMNGVCFAPDKELKKQQSVHERKAPPSALHSCGSTEQEIISFSTGRQNDRLDWPIVWKWLNRTFCCISIQKPFLFCLFLYPKLFCLPVRSLRTSALRPNFMLSAISLVLLSRESLRMAIEVQMLCHSSNNGRISFVHAEIRGRKQTDSFQMNNDFRNQPHEPPVLLCPFFQASYFVIRLVFLVYSTCHTVLPYYRTRRDFSSLIITLSFRLLRSSIAIYGGQYKYKTTLRPKCRLSIDGVAKN